MNSEELSRPGDDSGTARTRFGGAARSRKRAVAATAGVAVVLGAGAYLTTSALVSEETPVAREFQPTTPITAEPSAASPSPTPAGPTTPAATKTEPRVTVTAHAAQAPEENEDQTRKKIMAARKKAEKDGFPVKRPLEPVAGGVPSTEKNRPLPGGGTMRITTAKGDLTGQRPLNWVTDEGSPSGDSRCTRKFRFTAGDPGTERPTMLLCWRTSGSRSVAVLSIDPDGKPAVEQNTRVLEEEWDALG